MPLDIAEFPAFERSSVIDGEFRITTFDLLPQNLIAHIAANEVANSATRGPNQLFLDLQGMYDAIYWLLSAAGP